MDWSSDAALEGLSCSKNDVDKTDPAHAGPRHSLSGSLYFLHGSLAAGVVLAAVRRCGVALRYAAAALANAADAESGSASMCMSRAVESVPIWSARRRCSLHACMVVSAEDETLQTRTALQMWVCELRVTVSFLAHGLPFCLSARN